MTNDPTRPTFQAWNPPPSPPERPFYKRTWFIVTATLGVFAVVGALVVAALVGAASTAVEEATSVAQDPITTEVPAPPAAGPSVAPAERYDTPKVSDFRLVVKELSRTHYGYGLGDNVEYQVELVQVADKRYDPDEEYRLKYRVTGDEQGPRTDTLLIRGDEYEEPFEELASTRRNVKLTAKVLSVEKA